MVEYTTRNIAQLQHLELKVVSTDTFLNTTSSIATKGRVIKLSRSPTYSVGRVPGARMAKEEEMKTGVEGECPV
jgi:hypothetical protein